MINGYVRIPIAQVLRNQRARSGSYQTLPMEAYTETRGPLYTLVVESTVVYVSEHVGAFVYELSQ